MNYRILLATVVFALSFTPVMAQTGPILRMNLRPMPPPGVYQGNTATFYFDGGRWYHMNYPSRRAYSPQGFYPYNPPMVRPQAYIPTFTRPISPQPMRIRITRRGVFVQPAEQFRLYFVPPPPNYLTTPGLPPIYQSPYYPPYIPFIRINPPHYP